MTTIEYQDWLERWRFTCACGRVGSWQEREAWALTSGMLHVSVVHAPAKATKAGAKRVDGPTHESWRDDE